MPVPPSLEDLVQAICQGKPIDWESLERDASPGFHNRLAALRVVEGIARVHRTTERDESGAAETPAAAAAPARWGHLELLEHVASGAFGDVYRAWDSGLDREVALKLLRRSTDAAAHADETLEEGRLLAKVRHPNVVTVYGAARFDGRAGIWMEFVRGRTLAEMVAQDGPLPPARVTSIGMALCHALAAVHGASLVHRDVKAQNVMVGDDGRIVLMDFGAVSAVRHAGLHRAGTPRYLAPEVAAGGPATVQSDIYSLGVTLRYLLTAVFDGRPGVISGGRAEHRLQAVLARATNAHPDDRFESAEAFGQAIASSIERPRNMVAIAVATALVTGLLAIVGTTARRGNLEESGRRALEQTWQAATPTRPPITVDRFQQAFFGTFSLHGIVSAMTGDERHGSLITFNLSSGDSRVWLAYSGGGHVESAVVARDDALMAYVWVDDVCRCVSLRTVDRTGRVRTLALAPGIFGIAIGDITSRRLVILTAREFMLYDLAVVDIDTNTVRVVRTLRSEPFGLSLSPDGRFVAFAMTRQSDPGLPHDIVVHEIQTGLEWRLLDSGGDRALPVWSPHGDQLFYIERAEGSTSLSAVTVVDGHRASLPAVLRRDIGRAMGIGFLDPNTFAYISDVSRSEVMVVDAGPAGFRGRQVRWMGAGASAPALSPDGQWLASSDWPGTGSIRVTGTDGRVVRAFPPSLGWQTNPVWSDDSKRLAFWDSSQFGVLLKVASLESGATREVLRRTRGNREDLSALAWMAGGHELLLKPDTSHVVAIDVDTGHQREIHTSPPGDSLGPIYVSPDGQSLAFCEGPTEGHEGEQAPIHVLPLGTHGKSLTRPASTALGEALIGWWPDGSLLEIRNAAGGMPNLYDLWRLPLDGTSPEPLGVTATGMVYASASSDAKRLAYSTETWGQELWLLKPVASQ